MMTTYPELIQVGILIVGIIGLFMNANKKMYPQLSSSCGYIFCNYLGG